MIKVGMNMNKMVKNIVKIIVVLILMLTTPIVVQCKKYNKIASVTLSGDEMLLSLVDRDRIVGLSGKINEDENVSNVVNEAKGYPKIENSVEMLLSLEPDLVLVANWVRKEFVQHLKDNGINVFVYETPRNFKEQKQLILDIASLVEEKEKGEKIVGDMERRVKILQEKIKKLNIEKKPRILLYTPLHTTSGANTTFDDMVNLIGGINVAAENGVFREQNISKELVIGFDPDIIIVPVWKKRINSEEFMSFLKNDESFQEIKALKNNKVYFLVYKKLSSTSQHMIDAIENLGEVVYTLGSE